MSGRCAFGSLGRHASVGCYILDGHLAKVFSPGGAGHTPAERKCRGQYSRCLWLKGQHRVLDIPHPSNGKTRLPQALQIASAGNLKLPVCIANSGRHGHRQFGGAEVHVLRNNRKTVQQALSIRKADLVDSVLICRPNTTWLTDTAELPKIHMIPTWLSPSSPSATEGKRQCKVRLRYLSHTARQGRQPGLSPQANAA